MSFRKRNRKEEEEQIIHMDVLKKLRYIFDKKQKMATVRLLFLIIIGTVFELLGVSAVQPLINVFLNRDALLEDGSIYRKCYDLFHLTDTTQLIVLLLAALITLYIVKNAYLIFMYNRQYKYIYSNMHILSARMMYSYLSRPYSYFTRKSSSELLRNVNQDISDFFGVIQALVQLATEGLVVLALVVYLFLKDRTITVSVGILLIILVVLFNKIYRVKLLRMGDKNRYYEAQVNKWVQQAFGGIKEVKVMNKEEFFYKEYDKAFQGRVHSEFVYHTLTTIPKPIIEAASMVALLGTAIVKIAMGTNLNYFIPTMSIFVVAAYRLLPSFNRITEYLGTIAYQKPAVTAIYNDLKEIESFGDKNKTSLSHEKGESLPLNRDIDINDLSFTYPDSDTKILDHVSFSIPRNSSVAFIGKSGAGKTTLADLILGILTPDGGCIYVDDININKNIDEWHRTIGYIPQSIYLLDDTVRANIAFGVPEDDIDEERLNNAIDKAQLRSTVDELQDGINTMVGERGIRFSGGQRQRIGIARALYAQPKVLVLDEATSSLDTETETAIMESIDALHGEITLIIIAHRLSTIKNCDKIYQIGDGKAQKVDSAD